MEIHPISNDIAGEDPMLSLLAPIKDDIDEIFCCDNNDVMKQQQQQQQDCRCLSGIQPTPLQDMMAGSTLFGNTVLIDSLFNQSSSSSSSSPPTSLFSSSVEKNGNASISPSTPYEVLEGILSEASMNATPSPIVNEVAVATPVASLFSSSPSSLFAGPSQGTTTVHHHHNPNQHHHDVSPASAAALSLMISTAEDLLADDILGDIPRTEFDLVSAATTQQQSSLSSSPSSSSAVSSSSSSSVGTISKRPHTSMTGDEVNIVPESTTSGNMNNNRPLKRTKLEDHMDQFDKLEFSVVASSTKTSTTRKQEDNDDDDEDIADSQRFRSYQTDKWNTKFEELKEFKKRNGHCQVPHTYKDNIELGRWTKRQRYQRKLYLDGNKSSTMTEERIVALDAIGFVWDSHTALWETRYKELVEFFLAFGHSNVPSSFPPNPKLAVWTKCQRRQRKLLMAGKSSNMSLARIERLNKVDFVWEVRQCN